MILDLYWTCGELDVLLQGFCNILNLELLWRLPVRGGSQNKHYKKNHTIHSSVNQRFYPCGTYICQLTDEPISHAPVTPYFCKKNSILQIYIFK
jgi:hypothetical protein